MLVRNKSLFIVLPPAWITNDCRVRIRDITHDQADSYGPFLVRLNTPLNHEIVSEIVGRLVNFMSISLSISRRRNRQGSAWLISVGLIDLSRSHHTLTCYGQVHTHFHRSSSLMPTGGISCCLGDVISSLQVLSFSCFPCLFHRYVGSPIYGFKLSV